MKKETRNCQNCKKDFTIESEDFNFYEKIKVPPPTFCPECRFIRRLTWRNCRSLYKRSCMLCHKSLISMYSDKDTAPVCCNECWNGDKRDQHQYARDYDFSRPFFEQLKELFDINPRIYLYRIGNIVNSDYTNYTVDNKNCYLAYSVIVCEDVFYSENIDKSKNTLDSLNVEKMDGCSYNVDCENNFNTHYAVKSQTCVDCYFVFDCTNCSNCFLSSNLRNQQYVFKNQKYTRDEYMEKIKEYKLNTYSGWSQAMLEFEDMVKNQAMHKYAFITASQDASGDYIINSKNVKDSFVVSHSENIRYGFRVLMNTKDSYDVSGIGWSVALCYEAMMASKNTYKDFFCFLTIDGSKECEYSLILKNCSNCFGCVGLNNAKYCIFNKQYTKEQYEELVPKIKQHMMDMPYVDQKGRVYRYGEFFPFDMCPFGYNEASTGEHFPITQDQAYAKGYKWVEKDKKDYLPTLESKDLPDSISDVDDSILDQVIACPNDGNPLSKCTSAYKIVSFELQFYKSKNLPLPRYCPNCRNQERVNKYKNPFKLWHRKCMNTGCQNEFETTYSPDRVEKVFCESCYNKAIY